MRLRYGKNQFTSTFAVGTRCGRGVAEWQSGRGSLARLAFSHIPRHRFILGGGRSSEDASCICLVLCRFTSPRWLAPSPIGLNGRA